MHVRIEEIVAIGGLIIAALTWIEARRQRENRKLRTHLRRALKDVRAFHMLETLYCEEASDGGLAFPRSFVSPLSIKRAMRAKLRAGGTETPSDHATPHQIAQQLEALK
jgi:hypothetical protein